MKTEFTFNLDVELPQAIMLTINMYMVHPEILEGFKTRNCLLKGQLYCNSRFIYAEQTNGMYTRASITSY